MIFCLNLCWQEMLAAIVFLVFIKLLFQTFTIVYKLAYVHIHVNLCEPSFQDIYL